MLCQSIIRTVEKQLAFVLQGGMYSVPDEKMLKPTRFANITNLSCGHHLLDLDSSQKRRPNASFHHHSFIQYLKRNRKRIKEWYDNMSHEHRMLLWKRARKGGKELRSKQKHQQQQKRVMQNVCLSLLLRTAKHRTYRKPLLLHL